MFNCCWLKNFFRTKKHKIIVVLAMVLTLFFGCRYFADVKAQIHPLIVSITQFDFGRVFPGESLAENFTVSLVGGYEGPDVKYWLEQKPKPKWPKPNECGQPYETEEEARAYCRAEPDDYDCCYFDLCGYLAKQGDEPGDKESEAYLGEEDTSDVWELNLKVPAILGFVGQNHEFGVVDVAGLYGCDISVNIDDLLVCNPEKELVLNGGFEEPIVAHASRWDIFPSGTTGLGWLVEWREDIPNSFGGWAKPEPANLELHREVNNWNAYDGSQYAELDSDWNGHVGSLNNEPASVKIYQDIETVIGKTYKLKFAFSPRPNTGASDNVLGVKWGGSAVATLGPVAGGGNVAWTSYEYDLVATTTITRLEFSDLGTANSLGVFLDAVSSRCQN